MFEPTGTLGERPVSSLILGAIRYLVPNEADTMDRLLVDAYDAIAGILQKTNNFEPSARVVPVFCLRRALYGDADIGFCNRASVVGNCETGRYFRRIDTQDVAGSTMQSDIAKIAGLKDKFLVVEEQAKTIGGVIGFWFYLLVRQEGDVGISIAKQRDQFLAHAAGQAAPMQFLEFHNIRKPSY